MGPAGGARKERTVVSLSRFSWESTSSLGRPMLGQAFEAQKIILIAARNCMTREKPIHGFAKHARQYVVAAHPHGRLWRNCRRRRVYPLQVPALQAFYAVPIFHSPSKKPPLANPP